MDFDQFLSFPASGFTHAAHISAIESNLCKAWLDEVAKSVFGPIITLKALKKGLSSHEGLDLVKLQSYARQLRFNISPYLMMEWGINRNEHFYSSLENSILAYFHMFKIYR